MLGEVIHGYRVDRALSGDKGGFGDVFFATHVDSGAEAVVKVLKPEMSALRDIVARFFNEARAAASIHHPGIVQIHNVGYHGDRAYLLMERLRGDDLETRLAAGPLPVDRAVVFLRQTAGAIGAAHERGIVHRDLKPANLFVVADPDVVGGERVKVLDFGIAKLTVDSGAGKTQGVFGTPSYMSPEQCASAGAVDARADLYSLGCIFYELVCGRPPFGHGGIELIAAHLRDTPPPPRAIAPWLPPAIEQVILRLLEKQPDRRIPSAAALVAALDEAAAASGLAGVSVPRMPVAGGPAASAPYLPSGGPFTQRVPSPSTLGSAAGAASTLPARKRGLGLWLGVGAMVVVGGAVAVVVAAGGRHDSGGVKHPPSGPDNAGVAITSPGDAAAPAAVTPDAALLAAVPTPAQPALPGTPDAASLEQTKPEFAQDSPDPRAPVIEDGKAKRAAQLVEAGSAAMRANEWERALLLFQRAATLDRTPATVFKLGVAATSAGHLDQGAAAMQEVLAASPGDVLASKARKMLVVIARISKENSVAAESRDQASEPAPSRKSRQEPMDPGTKADTPMELKKAGDQAMFASPMRAEEAIGLYQRGYALAPSPEALFDVAFAQFAAHHCLQARNSLMKLMAASPTAALAKKAEGLRFGFTDCVEGKDPGRPIR